MAKLPSWKADHLSLWTDLVEPPCTPCKVATAADVAEMEDEAQGAKFREVRAKISQDMATMTAYNAQVAENKKREHVVMVMHEKSQMQQGKEFLGKNKVLHKLSFAILEMFFSVEMHMEQSMDGLEDCAICRYFMCKYAIQIFHIYIYTHTSISSIFHVCRCRVLLFVECFSFSMLQ